MTAAAKIATSQESKKTLLWLLAVGHFGTLSSAAATIGIDVKTLVRAAVGGSVSPLTAAKLEDALGFKLEHLQLPISKALMESRS